jgi:hypothetical protein
MGRLVDQLDPAHIFDVHVTLIAGQEKAHRVAVAGLDALAVLVECDHGVAVPPSRIADRRAIAPQRLADDGGVSQLPDSLDSGVF